jgi:hypothetical protein
MKPDTRGEIVVCPECAREMRAAGLGNHMAAHRRQAAAGTTKRPAKRSRPTAASRGFSGHEAAMVALTALSPDGRVAISDLPEIFEWWAATVRLSLTPPK